MYKPPVVIRQPVYTSAEQLEKRAIRNFDHQSLFNSMEDIQKCARKNIGHIMYRHRYSPTDLKDYMCSGSGSHIKSVFCLGMNRSKIITLITIGLIQCNTVPLLDDKSRLHADGILKGRLLLHHR